MKKGLASAVILWAAGLFPGAVQAQPSASWEKFISPDKTFSFHYPRGWTVRSQESMIEVAHPAAGEQLLIVALPYERSKAPADSANYLLDAVRASTSPDIKASDWESNEAGRDTAVSFQVAYSHGEKSYLSDALVIKDNDSRQVFWFSFSGPRANYSRPRALAILQGLVSSLAKGAGSIAPDAALPASAAVERNSRAFLFVLEFALGAPLTGSQEETVLRELRRGWESQSDADRAKYDSYPKVVEAITQATDLKALEDLRRQLENATREWLETSDRNDPAVAGIAGALKEKGRVLVSGNPPLTVMAANAYSEMYAYSELLAKIPNAAPDQVSPSAAAKVKGRLLEAWSGFTAEERGQVASTPGLWVSLRSVLRYGSPADQSQVRARLVKIAAPAKNSEEPDSEAPSRDTQGAGKSNIVGNLIKHRVMMNIQQQTFSHYMYCRGFRSSIY